MAKYNKPDYKALYPDISDEVVEFLKKSDRKMEYQQYDRKSERCIIDREQLTVTFIPSREDSLERLTKNNTQFVDERTNVEDMVTLCLMLEKLRQCLDLLTADERKLIQTLFYDGITECEMAKAYGVSQQAINKKKAKILVKLKKLMEE